jgi:hypothetical protein
MGDPHFPSQQIIQPDSQDYQKGPDKENTKKEPQPAYVMRRVKSSGAAVRVHKITSLMAGKSFIVTRTHLKKVD